MHIRRMVVLVKVITKKEPGYILDILEEFQNILPFSHLGKQSRPIYRVSQKKHSYKIFGFGLFVVFWTPLDTDLDTFGLFGRF